MYCYWNERKMLSKFPFKINFINCGFLWALFYQECKSACVGVIVVSFFASLYYEKSLKFINANIPFIIFIINTRAKVI